jgi:type IV pilus assembly protein PilB
MHNQDVFLEQTLLEEARVSAEELETARRAPFVNLDDFEACFANTQLVPRAVAERYCLFPLFKIDNVLTLAMDDPLNLEAMDQARQFAKCEVDAVLCDRQQLRPLINRAYRLTQVHTEEADEETTEGEAATETSQPVVAAVNQILADAADQAASDIHINPDEEELRLRYRVDGLLQEQQAPPLSMHAGIVQRLKVMAHLDLTQTRRPQDGKFRFGHDGAQIDVRMSTLPTVCGENVVLRLLTNSQVILDFHELGVPTQLVTDLEEMISRPYGMLLVTGPTGCGKTTSLYTILHKLNDPSRNIMTIEDPVEIRLPYLRQIAIDRASGSRCHPRRRDPGQRDRHHRAAGGPDRAHGAGHSAHQRRARCRRAAPRLQPARLRDQLRGPGRCRPAARAPSLPALPGSRGH